MIGKTNALASANKNLVTTIRINQNISEPRRMITRIVNDNGIEAIRANSHRYTGTFANNVMTLKQLDDNDGTKYVDGTKATLTTLGTDVWMKLPKFYWKCTAYDTDVWDFSVAYGSKPDDSYKEWNGKDLIGVYPGYRASNKLYSVSGKVSSASVSHANFKTSASNRGVGYSLVKWEHHCMMAMLFYTQYGRTDSQEVLGFGAGHMEEKTGTTNTYGMFDTADVETAYNLFNFWGLEDWFGSKGEFLDNIIIDGPNSCVVIDNESSDRERTISIPDGYVDGYADKLTFGENIDLTPISSSASSTTGFCDQLNLAPTDEIRALYRASGLSGYDSGISFLSFIYQVGATADSTVGSRLAYRGDWAEV